MNAKKKTYIDNKEFENLIKDYKQEGEPDKYPPRLIELFDLLIENILQSFRFKVDFDDAKQECFILVLKTVRNFDPSRGSAFNYFTTVILNELKLLYSKNKRYTEKILEYQDRFYEQNPQYKPTSDPSRNYE